jgi:hypothetical protein
MLAFLTQMAISLALNSWVAVSSRSLQPHIVMCSRSWFIFAKAISSCANESRGKSSEEHQKHCSRARNGDSLSRNSRLKHSLFAAHGKYLRFNKIGPTSASVLPPMPHACDGWNHRPSISSTCISC